MPDPSSRALIARLPAGQPLELSQAVIGFFGAALNDCLLSAGDGLSIAADIVGGDNLPEQEIVQRLRRATRKLGKTLPKPIPEDEPDETLADDPLRLNAMRATKTGVEFGLGGAADVVRAYMAELVVAFKAALDETGAENYLTWDVTDRENGERYSVVLVKPGGLTPHEARQRADTEAERLRELCRANGIDPDVHAAVEGSPADERVQ